MAVLSEVVETLLVTSVHEEPELTDALRMSSDAIAALRVAVRVWAAVLVMKSVAEEPVSAEMSTLLKLMVGAVVSRV
jgi:hypothetical protein